jgi:hypothetical protein
MTIKTFTRAAAILAAVATGGAAQAVTTFTFGQATQVGSANTVRWARTSGTGAAAVYSLSTIVRSGLQPRYDFRFFFPDGSSQRIATRMTILATSSGAATLTGPSNMRIQQNLTGGLIRFTALAPTTIKGQTGTNVLTVAFTGGQINGRIGEGALSFQASEPGDLISYSSSFFNFNNVIDDNFAFSFTSVSPVAGLTGTGAARRLRAFTASSTATFGTSIVPEPATWAMLIVGFGMVGFASRRRRAVAA